MYKHKISEAINRLGLNLQGKTVLTEAATGAYAVTPVIAALAGAEVYAFTKNTRYGSVEDVKKQTFELLNAFNAKDVKLNLIEEVTPDIILKADIITNSGHLRPLNKEKLKHVKKGAVIPLMYEAWEWRDADLDIDFCKAHHIKIGATNERHPDVDVFNYLGDMALKLIFDAGLSLYKNNFILLCNNDFGPHIARVLSKICGALAVCDKKENRNNYEHMQIDWIGDFPDFEIPEKYRDSAAVVFTAYPFVNTWIGNDTEPIQIRKLKRELNNPFILRFAGSLDEIACKDELKVYPEHVRPGHMGILPSEIGFDPIIRLQAGGLKVGEMLLKNEQIYKGIPLVELI